MDGDVEEIKSTRGGDEEEIRREEEGVKWSLVNCGQDD